jgi:hypothetical protein
MRSAYATAVPGAVFNHRLGCAQRAPHRLRGMDTPGRLTASHWCRRRCVGLLPDCPGRAPTPPPWPPSRPRPSAARRPAPAPPPPDRHPPSRQQRRPAARAPCGPPSSAWPRPSPTRCIAASRARSVVRRAGPISRVAISEWNRPSASSTATASNRRAVASSVRSTAGRSCLLPARLRNSAGHSAASSRSNFFWILPRAFRGRASAKTMRRGRLCRASREATNPINSASSTPEATT